MKYSASRYPRSPRSTTAAPSGRVPGTDTGCTFAGGTLAPAAALGAITLASRGRTTAKPARLRHMTQLLLGVERDHTPTRTLPGETGVGVAARTRSAAFSPIAIAAVLVFAETMSGMTDASATRRPWM